MSNVVYLHGEPAPISRFLRVTEHRRIEDLLAADRLDYDRFIIEAGLLNEQVQLVSTLRARGYDLVLDTNVAELSSMGRFSGQAKYAPWANKSRPLNGTDLQGRSGEKLVEEIAAFAVKHGFTRVQAATHFILGALDPWLDIDVRNCIALRKALDQNGGKEIAIDYPVLLPYSALTDPAERRELSSKLKKISVQAIVFRVSGFGASATAAGTRKYIAAMQAFHKLGLPIIADGVGGLAALAIASFGAISGISFGVASKERFDASGWLKAPKPAGGGSAYNVLFPGIDSMLRREDAEALGNAPGGRNLLSCNDRDCCPHGLEDTLKDPKRHFLRQRARRIDRLAAIPELVRARHFLDNDLRSADQCARQAAKLRVSDARLSKRLSDSASRLDRMRDALENLEQLQSAATRSPSISALKSIKRDKKEER